MLKNETEIIKTFRMLSPKHQADLLDLVRITHRAENYAHASVAGMLDLKLQEYSVGNIKKLIKQRVKK